MAAIISEKFRIFNAKQFLESLSEGATGTEATSDERNSNPFFVGRPQRWNAYLEIYSVVGNFTLGETVYVTGSGITAANSPFRATVEAVYPNSILLSGVFPTLQQSLVLVVRLEVIPLMLQHMRRFTDMRLTKCLFVQQITTKKRAFDDMIALKRIGQDQKSSC